MHYSGRLLIVGASGYVGGMLFRKVSAEAVMGTYWHHPQPGLRWLDLADRSSIRRLVSEFKPSLVLFVGGMIDVDACELTPGMAFDINARAVSVFAETGTARIVYFSSDYVFDGERAPYDELAARRPINSYGASKKAGEDFTLQASPANVILRLAKVYGFSGGPNDTFARLFDRRETLLAAEDQFGSPVLIDDVVSATCLAIGRTRGGLYNVAGPDRLSRFHFHSLIAAHASPGYTVVPVQSSALEQSARRPADTSMSIASLRQCGWAPRTLPEGLRLTAARPRSLA